MSRVAATIGKYEPPHCGHKAYLLKLVEEFDKVIIMLGSRFECGYENKCISETERIQMLTSILQTAGVSEAKYKIVPVPDTETFDEWLDLVMEVCKQNGVTHFVTGNQEDILNVLEQRGQNLGFEMINPEEISGVPIHATYIRKLIVDGNWQELKKYIPTEVMPVLFKYSFKEIIAASQNRGIYFVQGRQTVDMVFLIRNITDGKIYVLLGKRAMSKKDFPGYLGLPGGGIDDKFEPTIDAVTKKLYKKTGLKLEILDRALFIVKFANIPNASLEQMAIVGIYSSYDEKVAGTKGGSSQCFGIFIEDDISKYEPYIKSEGDLADVKFYEIHEAISIGLAYEQSDMLAKAIAMFNGYPKLYNVTTENSDNRDESIVISFID